MFDVAARAFMADFCYLACLKCLCIIIIIIFAGQLPFDMQIKVCADVIWRLLVIFSTEFFTGICNVSPECDSQTVSVFCWFEDGGHLVRRQEAQEAQFLWQKAADGEVERAE